MKIVAIETIKYKGELKVPGTDSAVFECTKEIAEGLLAAKCAVLPQTLEQAGKSASLQKADDIIATAEKQAEEIIKAAEEKADEIIKAAQEKATATTTQE